MDERVLAFALVATVLTVTPGQDMALVTRNVFRGGTSGGLQTSGGILIGLIAWAALSAVGIAAIVAASATALTVLKLIGAAYLLYLGAITLWQSRHGLAHAELTAQPAITGRDQFRQGLLSNLSNPKVGIFYATLLPQFVEPGHSVIGWTSTLAAIHLAISAVWLVLFTLLVAQTRRTLTRPRVRVALERVTGTVLVGFGLKVARDAA